MDNNFKEALQKAIACEGTKKVVNISNLDGSNAYKSEMIFNKQGTVGQYQVRYHNRWCFYFKGEIVGQYFEGEKSICGGNSSKKTAKHFPEIREAVQDIFNVNLRERALFGLH